MGRPKKTVKAKEIVDYKTNVTDQIINEHDYKLDPTQQEYIIKNWDSVPPLQMTKKLFPDIVASQNTEEYKNIKRFFAKLSRNTPWFDLSNDDRIFIQKNARDMRPFELAKSLYPKKDIKPFSIETKTIQKLCEALGLVFDGISLDGDLESNYFPPQTESQLLKKINEADINAKYNTKDLNAHQRKCVESLRKYLNSARFLGIIRNYTKKNKRELFESTFIQATYDKPDLVPDELNAYINLCSDYVQHSVLQHQMDKLNQLLEDCVDDSAEGAKMQMSIADALSTKAQEYDKCQTRMQKLHESLSSKRKDRLDKEADVNASLAKFVELWKEEGQREKMLRIAEARNLEVEAEIDRIESMPEFIARVMGISKEEILNN